MTKMTMHDRMMAVYRKELPDRIPVVIYSPYLPRGSHERTLRGTGLGIIDWLPMVSFLAPPWHTDVGYIPEVKGVDLQVSFSWEDGQQVETRTYKTPVGTISRRSEKDPSYGSNWVTKFYITCPEDYKVVQYIVERTVFRKNDKAFSAKMRDLGDDGVVLARLDRSPYQKLLIELAGPEQFLIDLYTEPELVVELMETMGRRLDEAFEMVCESEAEVIWQPDNITSDMTPPDCFKKYCAPFYEKYARQSKEANKPFIIHMDGKLKALKNVIADCPFDAVESFSFSDIGGDISLSEARAAWKDKVILPNFPSTLCYKTEEEIELFLDRMLTEAGTKIPFMLQVSEDIPASEWPKTLSALCRFMEARGKVT